MADKKKDMVVMPDGRSLQSMKVAELKLELEKRGIPKNGSKKELIERLRAPLELEQLQRESQEGVAEIQPNKSMSKSLSNPFVELYLKQQEAILQQRESLREKGLSESESCDEPADTTEGSDTMEANNSKTEETPKKRDNDDAVRTDGQSEDHVSDPPVVTGQTSRDESETSAEHNNKHSNNGHTHQNESGPTSDGAAAQDDGNDPPGKSQETEVNSHDETDPPATDKCPDQDGSGRDATQDDGIKTSGHVDEPKIESEKSSDITPDHVTETQTDTVSADDTQKQEEEPQPLSAAQEEIKQTSSKEETEEAPGDGSLEKTDTVLKCLKDDCPSEIDTGKASDDKISPDMEQETAAVVSEDKVTPEDKVVTDDKVVTEDKVTSEDKVVTEDNESQFEPVYDEEIADNEEDKTDATEVKDKRRRSHRRSSRRHSETKPESQTSRRRLRRKSGTTRTRGESPSGKGDDDDTRTQSSDGELEEGEVEENTDTVPVIDITTQGFEIEDLGDSAKPQRTSRRSERTRDTPSSSSSRSKKTAADVWVETQTTETKTSSSTSSKSDRAEESPKETRKSERTRPEQEGGVKQTDTPSAVTGRRISLTRKRDESKDKDPARRKVTIDDKTHESSQPDSDPVKIDPVASRKISLVRKEKTQPEETPAECKPQETPAECEPQETPEAVETEKMDVVEAVVDKPDTTVPAQTVTDTSAPVEDKKEEKVRALINVKPRKISLRSRSDDTTNPDQPTRKRRRWGTDACLKTTDSTSKAISTDTLKGLIKDVKPPSLLAVSREEGQICSSSDSDVEIPSVPVSPAPLHKTVKVKPDDERSEQQQPDGSTTTTDADAGVGEVVVVEGEAAVQQTDEKPSGEGSVSDDDKKASATAAAAGNQNASPETSPKKRKDKTALKSVDKPLIVKRPAVTVTEEPVVQRKEPSPPRNTPTTIIHVTNLVRPFTLPQLKQLLSRFGSLDDQLFWIDKIKSHCFVTYATVEEASATRQALHGVKWPTSNPKFISIEFATQHEMDVHKGLIPAAVAPTKPVVEKTSPSKEKKMKLDGPPADDDWRAEREKRRQEREARRKAEDALLEKQKEEKLSKDKVRLAERSAVREKRIEEREQREKERKEKAKKVKEEEAPAKLLDDLFRKTKAEPCIYWLPLTNEQIVNRVKEQEVEQKKTAEELAVKEKERDEARQKRLKEIEERNKQRPPVRRSPVRRSSVRRSPVRRSSVNRSPVRRSPLAGRRRKRSPTPPPKKRSPPPRDSTSRRDLTKPSKPSDNSNQRRRAASSSSSSSGSSSSSSGSESDSSSASSHAAARKNPDVKRNKKN